MANNDHGIRANRYCLLVCFFVRKRFIAALVFNYLIDFKKAKKPGQISFEFAPVDILLILCLKRNYNYKI